MRSIQLQGNITKRIYRNGYMSTYLLQDTECGEVMIEVPKNVQPLYHRMDRHKNYRLLAKVVGSSYKKNLNSEPTYRNKLIIIKELN